MTRWFNSGWRQRPSCIHGTHNLCQPVLRDGPTRGVWYDLYVALDIFSRFVVAWTIAACEDGDIAKAMLEEAMGVHGIPDGPPGRRRRIPRPSPGP